MTGIQLFAFVILPLLITLGGGLVVLVFELRHPRRRPEPDLFEAPRRRPSLANAEGLGRSSKTTK